MNLNSGNKKLFLHIYLFFVFDWKKITFLTFSNLVIETENFAYTFLCFKIFHNSLDIYFKLLKVILSVPYPELF